MASSHATCPAPVQPTPFQHATDAGDRVGGRAWQVSSSTEDRCTKAKAGAGSGLRDITCCATQVCAAGPPMVIGLGSSLPGPPWVQPIGGGDSRRSEERRVGNECGSTGRSRGAPYPSKKKKNKKSK